MIKGNILLKRSETDKKTSNLPLEIDDVVDFLIREIANREDVEVFEILQAVKRSTRPGVDLRQAKAVFVITYLAADIVQQQESKH